MTEWLIKGSRVYTNGEGKSYNLTNKVTANDLYHTLTTYENNTKLNQNIEEKYTKLTQQLIQVNMTLQILNEEITKLTSDIHDIKSNNR